MSSASCSHSHISREETTRLGFVKQGSMTSVICRLCLELNQGTPRDQYIIVLLYSYLLPEPLMITTIGAIARNLTAELRPALLPLPLSIPPSPNRSPTYLALIGIMLRQTCPIQYLIMLEERGERAAAEYRISPTAGPIRSGSPNCLTHVD